MPQDSSFFFCGVGGSGMMPLALILKASGASVEGSDRAYDSGRTGDKFAFLRSHGVNLYPQNGSGVRSATQTVVVSAAIESDVPDVRKAQEVGAQIVTRAHLLAQLFNAAPISIAIAGTSGKSTATGMTGWIFEACGRKPTILNGAVMKNFITADAPFASSKLGEGRVFVSEVDESDGSIAQYRPHIGVLNNIAFDHKPLAELRPLFASFLAASRVAIVNADNAEAAAIARALPGDHPLLMFGLHGETADLTAEDIKLWPASVEFVARNRLTEEAARVRLHVPGRHNVENALAALGAAAAAEISLADAANALAGYKGLRRRMDIVGVARGVTVIDDFAHNPDKIAATLSTLHAFPGRLIVMFQPHGFGPLKLMKNELIEAFVRNMGGEDVLLMPEPVYFGGTVERAVSSQDIAEGVSAGGRTALALPDREACGAEILARAAIGDRIVIMGARDDSLSTFAGEMLAALNARS